MITHRETTTERGGRLSVRLLDSIVDVPELIEIEHASGVNGSRVRWWAAEVGRLNPSFLGGLTEGEPEARALLRDGWAFGAERAVELIEGLDLDLPEARRLTRRVRYAEQGDEVVMGSYLTGQWDRAWRSTPRDRETAGQKIISVDIGFGANANVKGEDMFWGPAAAAALAERLEDSGFRVEINAVKSTAKSGTNNRALLHVRIKDADRPMDLNGLVALTAHAGVARCYGIAASCAIESKLGTGMGSHRPSAGDLERAVKAGFIEPADITFEACYSREAAIRQVEAALLKVETIASREVAY